MSTRLLAKIARRRTVKFVFGAIGLSAIGVFVLLFPSREWEENLSGAYSSPNADTMSLPPPRREFFSKRRNYLFVVANHDRWKSERVRGELFEIKGKRRDLLWARELSHAYGPRYGLVTGRGNVLLIDEWFHKPNGNALSLFDRRDSPIARYSFSRLVKLTEIDRLAKMYETRDRDVFAPPIADELENKAKITLWDKTISIDLNTGAIARP